MSNNTQDILDIYKAKVMPTYAPSLVLASGTGVTVRDVDNRVYYDFTSGIAVHNVGLRYLHKNEPNKPSNADALLGRTGRVTEAIKAGGNGYVQIDGDLWKAVSQTDIAVGTTVRVIGRESTIITVEAL